MHVAYVRVTCSFFHAVGIVVLLLFVYIEAASVLCDYFPLTLALLSYETSAQVQDSRPSTILAALWATRARRRNISQHKPVGGRKGGSTLSTGSTIHELPVHRGIGSLRRKNAIHVMV
jgi:hypothetical protein